MSGLKKTTILDTFGDRIRTLRKAQGLSQEELAMRCELDRTYIGGVERGERNVSLLNIQKISLALSTSISEVFSCHS